MVTVTLTPCALRLTHFHLLPTERLKRDLRLLGSSPLDFLQLVSLTLEIETELSHYHYRYPDWISPEPAIVAASALLSPRLRIRSEYGMTQMRPPDWLLPTWLLGMHIALWHLTQLRLPSFHPARFSDSDEQELNLIKGIKSDEM